MKFAVDTKQFKAAFDAAARIVKDKTARPILAFVKIAAADGRLAITATDLELSVIRTVSGVAIEEPGECLIRKDALADIVRTSNSELLQFASLPGGKVRVSLGGRAARFDLPTGNLDEYPSPTPIADGPPIIVDAGALQTAIRRTIHVCDVSTQYAFEGLKFQWKDSTLRISGINGRIGVSQEIPAEVEDSSDADLVVHRTTLGVVQSALSDDGTQVQIRFRGGGSVQFDTPNATILSRLLAGRQPDFRQYWAGGGIRFDVQAGAFLSALCQAGTMSSDESRGVDFDLGLDTLTMRAASEAKGSSEVYFPAEATGSMSWCLDPNHLGACIRPFDADATLTLECIGPKSPFQITSPDGFEGMIMPLVPKGER